MGKFVVKPAKGGYRFNLVANNGEIIATSSEAYPDQPGCLEGVEGVRRAAQAACLVDRTAAGFQEAEGPRFEIYADKAGEFRFRLKAPGGGILAVSEGYKAKASCKRGIASVRKHAPGAALVVKEA